MEERREDVRRPVVLRPRLPDNDSGQHGLRNREAQRPVGPTEERTSPMRRIYDTAIVGSGPAGSAAATQAAWSGLGTIWFRGFEAGGCLMLVQRVENYPGFSDEGGVPGAEVADRMEAQAV